MDTNCAEEWSCAKAVANYLKAIVYVALLNEQYNPSAELLLTKLRKNTPSADVK